MNESVLSVIKFKVLSVWFFSLNNCLNVVFIALKIDSVSVESMTSSGTASWCYVPISKFYVSRVNEILITWITATSTDKIFYSILQLIFYRRLIFVWLMYRLLYVQKKLFFPFFSRHCSYKVKNDECQTGILILFNVLSKWTKHVQFYATGS